MLLFKCDRCGHTEEQTTSYNSEVKLSTGDSCYTADLCDKCRRELIKLVIDFSHTKES